MQLNSIQENNSVAINAESAIEDRSLDVVNEDSIEELISAAETKDDCKFEINYAEPVELQDVLSLPEELESICGEVIVVEETKEAEQPQKPTTKCNSSSAVSTSVIMQKAPNQDNRLHLNTENHAKENNIESEVSDTISTAIVEANKLIEFEAASQPTLLLSASDKFADSVSCKVNAALLDKTPAEPPAENYVWTLEFGYGFYMKNRYCCNVNRSSKINSCKASFASNSEFITHLSDKHQLTKENGKFYRMTLYG